MSKKRCYRATPIKKVDTSKLSQNVLNKRIAFGVDIGKEEVLGALMNEQQQVIQIIKWKSPHEILLVIELLKNLPVKSLEVALEPTGPYGDAFEHILYQQGIAVYKINPKRTHDAQEVYDGVPSSHDAKSAAIVAKLHLDGLTRSWRPKSNHERILAAAVTTLGRHKKHMNQYMGRMESQLARTWPEVTQLLAIDSKTLLSLLHRFGCPKEIAAHETEAMAIMQTGGGRFLSEDKRDEVLRSAKDTIGVAMIASERLAMQSFSEEMLLQRKALLRAEREIRNLARSDPQLRAMSQLVGAVTAVVLFAKVGNPKEYLTSDAYVKGLGLNLKIRESGKHKGRLKITKRGPGLARHYLYYTALRMIYREPIFKAWYQKKYNRQGGQLGNKAVIALMRKLAKALWHVARGEVFDPGKLFDTRRLTITQSIN